MKYLLTFLLLSGFISTSSLGQDSTEIKRKAYRLLVKVDSNTLYEEDLKESPYVYPNNTIQLYPGETINVEVGLDNSRIKTMTAVPEIKDPGKTLVISFLQVEENKVHKSMMLTVKNPFPKKLTYNALIFILNQQKWTETNVYRVEPGLSGIEIWPDVITSIMLTNLALVSE